MPPSTNGRPEQLIEEARDLIARHAVLESVARRQETPRSALPEQIQRRQNLVQLEQRLRTLHPADVPSILESVPPDHRLIVWSQLQPAKVWDSSCL